MLTGVFTETSMGPTGIATSGAVFFNHLSGFYGDVAWYDEIVSLDLSMGHSAMGGDYHYHGVSTLLYRSFKQSSMKYLDAKGKIYFICISEGPIPHTWCQRYCSLRESRISF